jgi:hypothetical protein
MQDVRQALIQILENQKSIMTMLTTIPSPASMINGKLKDRSSLLSDIVITELQRKINE